MKKTTGQKILDLFQCMQLINDGIKQVDAGVYRQIVNIAVQLRALLLDTSNGKTELFFDCLAFLDSNDLLKLYVGEENDLQVGPYILHQNLLDVSFSEDPSHSHQMDFREWLQTDILTSDIINFSIAKIFQTKADKEGGAHYDIKFSKNEMELLNCKYDRQQLLVDFIIKRIACIVRDLGLRVIKSQCDFHILFSVGLKDIDSISKNINLLTFAEGTYVPVSFFISKSKILFVRFTDEHNRDMFFPIASDIHDGILFISLGYEINSDFHGELTTYSVDGKQISSQKIENPYFIYNKFTQFPGQWFSDENFSMGLLDFMSFSKVLDEEKLQYLQTMVEIDGNASMFIIEGRHYATRTAEGLNFPDSEHLQVCSYNEWKK